MSILKTDFKCTIFALFINLAQWKSNAINIINHNAINIICIPFLKTAFSFFSLKLYTQNVFKHNGSQL